MEGKPYKVYVSLTSGSCLWGGLPQTLAVLLCHILPLQTVYSGVVDHGAPSIRAEHVEIIDHAHVKCRHVPLGVGAKKYTLKKVE